MTCISRNINYSASSTFALQRSMNLLRKTTQAASISLRDHTQTIWKRSGLNVGVLKQRNWKMNGVILFIVLEPRIVRLISCFADQPRIDGSLRKWIGQLHYHWFYTWFEKNEQEENLQRIELHCNRSMCATCIPSLVKKKSEKDSNEGTSLFAFDTASAFRFGVKNWVYDNYGYCSRPIWFLVRSELSLISTWKIQRLVDQK